MTLFYKPNFLLEKYYKRVINPQSIHTKYNCNFDALKMGMSPHGQHLVTLDLEKILREKSSRSNHEFDMWKKSPGNT